MALREKRFFERSISDKVILSLLTIKDSNPSPPNELLQSRRLFSLVFSYKP